MSHSDFFIFKFLPGEKVILNALTQRYSRGKQYNRTKTANKHTRNQKISASMSSDGAAHNAGRIPQAPTDARQTVSPRRSLLGDSSPQRQGSMGASSGCANSFFWNRKGTDVKSSARTASLSSLSSSGRGKEGCAHQVGGTESRALAPRGSYCLTAPAGATEGGSKPRSASCSSSSSSDSCEMVAPQEQVESQRPVLFHRVEHWLNDKVFALEVDSFGAGGFAASSRSGLGLGLMGREGGALRQKMPSGSVRPSTAQPIRHSGAFSDIRAPTATSSGAYVRDTREVNVHGGGLPSSSVAAESRQEENEAEATVNKEFSNLASGTSPNSASAGAGVGVSYANKYRKTIESYAKQNDSHGGVGLGLGSSHCNPSHASSVGHGAGSSKRLFGAVTAVDDAGFDSMLPMATRVNTASGSELMRPASASSSSLFYGCPSVGSSSDFASRTTSASNSRGRGSTAALKTAAEMRREQAIKAATERLWKERVRQTKLARRRQQQEEQERAKAEHGGEQQRREDVVKGVRGGSILFDDSSSNSASQSASSVSSSSSSDSD